MDPEDDGLIQSINIILIGKTGVGKSSTGNTILGKEYFKPGNDFLSETLVCEWGQQRRNGIKVTVVDTPGIFHSHLSEEKVKQEIAENTAIMTPGPDVLLMVVKGNGRFTKVEEMVYSQLKEIFGQEFRRHVIVVFTGLDAFKHDASDSVKIVYTSSPALHKMVVESGERVVVLNNYAEREERERQANELVNCCVKLVRANKKKCYSTEHLKIFTKKTRRISEENPTLLVDRIYTYWFTPSETLQTIRIVLIGKTGVGKSATGNTILGEDCFATRTGWCSVSQNCGRKKRIKDWLEIQVTDTPGVCDTHRPDDEIQLEIAKVIASMIPGPHALLFVVKANGRFTKEEKIAYEALKEIFGQELKHYMIVVFTGMDDLTKTNFENEIIKAPPDLKTVLEEANNRYVCVNNRAIRKERDVQAKELLTHVKKLIATNRGNYYSPELIKKFEVKLQKIAIESGKTQNEIIDDIVDNANSSFTNQLIYSLRLLNPKQLCRIM